jgi:hypothetical protein
MGAGVCEVTESIGQPNWLQKDILIENMWFPPTNFKLFNPIKRNHLSLQL